MTIALFLSAALGAAVTACLATVLYHLRQEQRSYERALDARWEQIVDDAIARILK